MSKHQLCRNCGHTVEENYCPACGQRTSTHRLDWASLAENVTSTFIGDEAYGLRGMNMRKGTVTTWLAILFQPHKTITEYIAGHRRKYFNPVAILLLLSTFYAVVYALVGKTYTPLADDGQQLLVWLLFTYIDYASLHPAANMLLALPLFALALKTVFRKRAGLKFVEYLYIGIFLSIFKITLMILGLPAELLVEKYNTFYALTFPMFLYMAFVLWKLFGLKKRGALLRALVTEVLQYLYAAVAGILLLAAILTGYYLIAPDDFKQMSDGETKFERIVTTLVDFAVEERKPGAEEAGAGAAAAPEGSEGSEGSTADVTSPTADGVSDPNTSGPKAPEAQNGSGKPNAGETATGESTARTK